LDNLKVLVDRERGVCNGIKVILGMDSGYGKISNIRLKFFEITDLLNSYKLFLDLYEKCLQPNLKAFH